MSRMNPSIRNRSHETPATGQAMKISHIGRSASSEVWFQPNLVKSMPHQIITPVKIATKPLATMRRIALVRGEVSFQMSTSKCSRSRTPMIAPIITIQMKKKRLISSVHM